MENSNANKPYKITLDQLYPDLTPEQREEAAYWIRRYLDVVRRIYERTHRKV